MWTPSGEIKTPRCLPFLLVQTKNSLVALLQPMSIIHCAFTRPTSPKSIFLCSACVCVCVFDWKCVFPARAPFTPAFVWWKISCLTESTCLIDSCSASCSALASTWVWLTSLRICFDWRYITPFCPPCSLPSPKPVPPHTISPCPTPHTVSHTPLVAFHPFFMLDFEAEVCLFNKSSYIPKFSVYLWARMTNFGT